MVWKCTEHMHQNHAHQSRCLTCFSLFLVVRTCLSNHTFLLRYRPSSPAVVELASWPLSDTSLAKRAAIWLAMAGRVAASVSHGSEILANTHMDLLVTRRTTLSASPGNDSQMLQISSNAWYTSHWKEF